MAGNDRQSQADCAHNDDKHDYKSLSSGRNTKHRPAFTQILCAFSLKQVALYTVGTMVSAWFLAKVSVTFVPLTNVAAQYATSSVLPELLDATADELISGLEAGRFTSLNLVQVSIKLCDHS